MNPLVGFGGSIARNCGEIQIFCMWKLSEASRETFVLEALLYEIWRKLARNDHFGSFFCEDCRKHRAKRSFWKLVLWNLSEASHETIILEACSVKFRGSLARNDLFGSFFCEFRGSLARNDRFGSFFCENCRKHRAKRSFCKLVLWNFEEASHETIVLEAFSGKICRKHRAKRSFWKLVLWNLEEASYETIFLETFCWKFFGSLARNDHFGSFFFEFWRKLCFWCFLYEFFFYQASPFPAVPCTWGFAFYRTTKYQKRYIFRYRRRYHFVAIRDCWSAIIVDTLFGGQLIHSYI